MCWACKGEGVVNGVEFTEAIRKEAVREFAAAMHKQRRYVGRGTYLLYWEDIEEIAAERGAIQERKDEE